MTGITLKVQPLSKIRTLHERMSNTRYPGMWEMQLKSLHQRLQRVRCNMSDAIYINCARNNIDDNYHNKQLKMPFSPQYARITKEKSIEPFKVNNKLLSSSLVKCSMWNVTSMVNKTPKMKEHLLDRDPGIVFLSET